MDLSQRALRTNGKLNVYKFQISFELFAKVRKILKQIARWEY